MDNELIDILESVCNKYPNSKIIIDSSEILYKTFYEHVKRVAVKLKNTGVTLGTKVGISVVNPIDYFVLMFAINDCGGVIVPIYPETGDEKIRIIIEKYEIQFFICISDAKLSENEQLLVVSKEYKLCKYDYVHDSLCEDVAMILFTSGTTNLPKAIMLTNNNIISNIKGIASYLEIDEADSMFLVKSLYHASTIIGEFFVGILCGCNIYFSAKLPKTNNILSFLNKNQITVFFAVPTILEKMISYSQNSGIRAETVMKMNFYGAKMHYDKICQLGEVFTNAKFFYSYGQTEASPRVTYITGEELKERTTSSGKTIEDVTVKIVDLNDNEIPRGDIGEIIIYGPNVMKGYYKNPKLTSEKIKNGWLYTGDVGYVDSDGYLYVKGRKDNMIISVGRNIYLEEIEEVILMFSGVREVLAYVNQYKDGMAEISAKIVCETDIVIKDLYSHLAQYLERYKIPRSILIVEELPKTPSGKIKRG